jgi:hypothetical protein
MFADDIVIISTSLSKLCSLFSHVRTFCDEHELDINASKTELLVCGSDAHLYTTIATIDFDDLSFQVV